MSFPRPRAPFTHAMSTPGSGRAEGRAVMTMPPGLILPRPSRKLLEFWIALTADRGSLPLAASRCRLLAGIPLNSRAYLSKQSAKPLEPRETGKGVNSQRWVGTMATVPDLKDLATVFPAEVGCNLFSAPNNFSLAYGLAVYTYTYMYLCNIYFCLYLCMYVKYVYK